MRILVIRGGAIGDFILTLPAIRLLRENFPAAHIEILGYEHIVTLACDDRYYANASRSIEYGPLSAFFIPRGELSKELMEYFGSFQQVVSYLFDPDKIFEANIRRCGVKHFLHVSPKLDDSAHASNQLAAPLQSLALYLENPAAELFPSAQDQQAADQLLAGTSGRPLAIHPGSGGERKNWALENWIQITRWILEMEKTCTLLLIGGEADFARLDELRGTLPEGRVRELRNVPLPHLSAVLSRCRVFAGHDSGISHLAAASKVPSVLLFGPTDSDVWAPANPGVTVITAMDGDISGISVAEVKSALAEKLRDAPSN